MTIELLQWNDNTFWPAHLTLLMPLLTHNWAEFCKLHLLDLTKISLSSERPKSCNSHSCPKRRAETPKQCFPRAILFTICTVPTENDCSQRISHSNPPAWLRWALPPAQPRAPGPGGDAAGTGGDAAGTGILEELEGSSWGRSGVREALALLVLPGWLCQPGWVKGLGLAATLWSATLTGVICSDCTECFGLL